MNAKIKKEINGETVLDEYEKYYEKYCKIYGSKVVVFYRNGHFFELYGIDNDEEKVTRESLASLTFIFII